MIRGGQFFDVVMNYDGTTDCLWCQSANSHSNIGLWYYPVGNLVPLATAFGNFDARSPKYSKSICKIR